ncbi:tpr repeat protein [Pelomyxa schiedti]|nr:tpr repeat protein [Pelomyxa schiedti]
MDNAEPKAVDDELEGMPLFATRTPQPGEPMSDAMMALQDLLYGDGQSPFEVASNFKRSGNDQFGMGPAHYDDAIQSYTTGISTIDTELAKPASGDKDAKLLSLRSTLLSNRAAVNSKKGNHGRVIEDCSRAVVDDASNAKAWWRIAFAEQTLEHHTKALEWCDRALSALSLPAVASPTPAVSESAAATSAKTQQSNTTSSSSSSSSSKPESVVDQIKALRAKSQTALDASLSLQQKKAAEREQRKRVVENAITQRGIRIGPGIIDTTNVLGKTTDENEKGTAKFDEDTAELCFPCVVVYEEYSQTDIVEEWWESQKVRDILSMVLENRPPWDVRGDYTPDTVDVLCVAEAPAPNTSTSTVGSGKKKWLRLRKDLRLTELLSRKDFYLPGGKVILFVVPTNEVEFKQPFLSSYLSSL